MCDIRQLVHPSNTENITLITGVPATILMAVFMTLNLYILGIKTPERVDINSRCHACQNILKDQSEMKMIMDK